MVIGDMCDLLQITREDLYQHYRRFYAPNNAVLVLAGDVDTEAILVKIEALFGVVPAGQPLPPLHRDEPPQAGGRRVTVEGDGTTTYVELAFRAPPATDPDFFPMLAMNAVLAGIGRLSPFGSGAANRSSRLYRALVETELASSVGGDLPITLDPYLYTLSATVRGGRTPEEVEAAIWNQVERLTADLATEEELNTALKQARAQFAYSSESVTRQALWLGFSEVVAGHTWFLNFMDRLDAVTLEDVRRVAATYLARRNCTVGWYVPEASPGAEGAA
jgi:zinc protease